MAIKDKEKLVTNFINFLLDLICISTLTQHFESM